MTAKSIVWILALGGAVSVFTPLCVSQTDYCGYEVVVRSSDGKPVVAVVTVLQSGKPFATAITDSQGIARFCDAPAAGIDIQVGGNACGSVLVRYLSPLWMKTRRVFVTFDNCSEGFTVSTGCYLWIRVRDSCGKPVSAVHLELRKTPDWGFEQSYLTDRYGRLFWYVPMGKTIEGTLLKDGYSPLGLREECRPGSPIAWERVMVLEHLRKPEAPSK